MNKPFLRFASAAGLLSAALFLFSGCQYWEDLFDDSKPPPDKPLTETPSVLKTYTEDQAVSFVSTKLMISLGRFSSSPGIIYDNDDRLAGLVVRKLLQARIIHPDPQITFTLKSAEAEPGFWHPVLIDRSGAAVLDLNLKLEP